MKFQGILGKRAIRTVIMLFLISQIRSQIVASLNTTEVYIFPEATIQTDQYYSSTFPADKITFATFTPQDIWTLSKNNTVQIFDKNDLTQKYKAITEESSMFQFQSTDPLSMIVFDQDYSIMAITGFINSQIIFYLYGFANTTIPFFMYSFSIQVSYTNAPTTSFIADQVLYFFFSNDNQQSDTIIGISLINNSTTIITLPTSSAFLAVSPNKEYALTWTDTSIVYIYSIPSFRLLYIYSGSISVQKGTTNSITFSFDSTLALIQTDNKNPIRIFDLSSLTVLQSITTHGKIISANFLDIDNRFIFIDFQSKAYVYDRNSTNLWSFNSSIEADSVFVDQNSSQLLVALGDVWNLMGINVTIDGIVIYGHYFPTQTTQTDPTSSMSYTLNLSQAQNQTFAGLQSASAVVLDVMTNINLVIFSSPFTCFFLGFFNYFTLNSLYILLNIQLPDIIFKELSALYASSNANLLTSFGITFSPAPLTHELVDSSRALYFGLSSDFLSTNYYPFGLVILNCLLFELLLAIRRRLSRTNLVYSLLDFDRHNIYFGFAVYLMVGLILPSRFVLTKRLSDWPTVVNSAVQCLFYAVVAQFLWSSLVQALDSGKQKGGKNKVKGEGTAKAKGYRRKDMPAWMIAFQNLLLPLLVLQSTPFFFLAIVLVSKIAEIIVFAYHSRQRGISRGLQIGSFFCEVIYHCTFIVFSLTRTQEIIIYNSLFCLIFFYLGAVLNLAWTILFLIKMLKAIISAKKQNSKVADKPSAPMQKDKYHIKLKKITFSHILVCEQAKNVEKIDIGVPNIPAPRKFRTPGNPGNRKANVKKSNGRLRFTRVD